MNTNNITNNEIVCRSVIDNAFQFGNVRAGYVPVDVLFIDYAYQRRPQSRIKQIAANWDDNKCGFLTVNYRPDVGKFAIIDGQNRFTAACMAGKKSLPCHILVGESKEKEAWFFANQDDNVTRVTPYDKFRAELVYGNKLAIKLKEVCDDYGIIVKASNPDQVRHLRSVTTAKEIIRCSGEDTLRLIFDIIRRANWHTAKRAYSAVIIRALYSFINYYGDGNKIEILISQLKLQSPDYFIRESIGFAGDETRYSGLARLFIELVK